ncbi:hypothetical protein VNO77_27065 [Canavalia gladiata]|uniref:Uncharacterized protein n=1 Tax=Canavalia gladiata TaxID=3824 RepID=A0AAN9KY66_CANGL
MTFEVYGKCRNRSEADGFKIGMKFSPIEHVRCGATIIINGLQTVAFDPINGLEMWGTCCSVNGQAVSQCIGFTSLIHMHEVEFKVPAGDNLDDARGITAFLTLARPWDDEDIKGGYRAKTWGEELASKRGDPSGEESSLRNPARRTQWKRNHKAQINPILGHFFVSITDGVMRQWRSGANIFVFHTLATASPNLHSSNSSREFSLCPFDPTLTIPSLTAVADSQCAPMRHPPLVSTLMNAEGSVAKDSDVHDKRGLITKYSQHRRGTPLRGIPYGWFRAIGFKSLEPQHKRMYDDLTLQKGGLFKNDISSFGKVKGLDVGFEERGIIDGPLKQVDGGLAFGWHSRRQIPRYRSNKVDGAHAKSRDSLTRLAHSSTCNYMLTSRLSALNGWALSNDWATPTLREILLAVAWGRPICMGPTKVENICILHIKLFLDNCCLANMISQPQTLVDVLLCVPDQAISVEKSTHSIWMTHANPKQDFPTYMKLRSHA